MTARLTTWIRDLLNGTARIGGCREGNFALMFALSAPVLIGATGIAVDMTQMMLARSEMSSIADSASLAAAKAMADDGKTEAQAKALAQDLITSYASQQGSMLAGTTIARNITVNTSKNSDGGAVYDVKVDLSQNFRLSPLMNVLGQTTAAIATSATSRAAPEGSAQTAMSMYLVLDRSGSMEASTEQVKSWTKACPVVTIWNEKLYRSWPQIPCYYSQIEALQLSAGNLFDTFATADPSNKYIRVGSVSYNTAPQKETPLAWGTTASRNYINALTADGGTSSKGAFKVAYTQLSLASENATHLAKNKLVPKKYILFMTDGANNSPSDNTKTLELCAQAKTAGMTVYTVAFNAPPEAKPFLAACASSATTYFDAADAAGLAAAFSTIGKATSGQNPTLIN